ncbi:hypothetical protein WJX72_006241 [[Myrmecia] bisecta]|uniref:Elongator complex protein 4 n=1 Tax=[Myrmecia] bisecta TaxID=41462 RepID=A0AAW1Q6D5_9CHLO
MSSFVRRAAPAAVPADPGTRPGLHGQTLISTGLADLDKILGGGLPLGSILLVLEHPWSAHHQTLLKYFVAEGVACGHAVHWAVPRLADGGVTSMLPKQITPKDAAQQKEQDERSKKEDEVQLRIAWQYRRYIKSKQKADAKADSEPGTSASPRRAGSSFQRKGAAGSGSAVAAGLAREWCHHYDLTKPMAEEQVRDSRLDCQAHSGDDALDSVAFAAESLVCSVSGRPAPDRQSWGWTATATPKPKPKLSRREQGPAGVGRLAISSLANADWELLGAERPELERQLMRLLFRIKGLLRESRCAAMVSIPAGSFSPALALRLQHFCDAVLQLESVGDDSDIVRLATDSPSVHGVLHVRKLPGLHTLVRPQPLVSLYVIRNKRRRIHIEGFQVDPDAEAAEADAAAGGAKSAASMMCAGPPNASKALDF